MSHETPISKYLSMIGRKGGKASGKARMEKLTPEQRTRIARTAAAARWAKPVTQTDLQRQSALQAAEWAADRAAQTGAQEIEARLAAGSGLKPGKLTFNKRLRMATAAPNPVPDSPGVGTKPPGRKISTGQKLSTKITRHRS